MYSESAEGIPRSASWNDNTNNTGVTKTLTMNSESIVITGAEWRGILSKQSEVIENDLKDSQTHPSPSNSYNG